MENRRVSLRRVLVNANYLVMIAIAVGAVAIMKDYKETEYNLPFVYWHNDLPYSLYIYERNRINAFDWNRDLTADPKWSNRSHTDIPRLLKGKVGALIWVAYVPCDTQYKDAVERTLEQIDVIKRMIAKYPQHMKLAKTTIDIMYAYYEEKIGSLIAVEGGHSIDSRPAVLRMYYQLGVRYMTLTHTCNTPWVDASPVDGNTTAVVKNVTEWGKTVIWEMNRLGMMIDISHVSHAVMGHVLKHSQAPVIYSHSSSYDTIPHRRKLIEGNGIIMVKFDTEFIGGNTIDDFAAHLNDMKKNIDPDHIGLGSDYHEADSPHVSKYPELFDMLRNGTYSNGTTFDAWTRIDVRKLIGGNLLRVFRVVQWVRGSMGHIPPYEDLIPYQEFIDAGVADQPCMSDMDIHKN